MNLRFALRTVSIECTDDSLAKKSDVARRRRPLIRQCEIPAAREHVHVGPVDFDLELAPLAIPLVVLRVVDQFVAVARIVESVLNAILREPVDKSFQFDELF